MHPECFLNALVDLIKSTSFKEGNVKMGGSLHQNKTLQLTIFHYNILISESKKLVFERTCVQCVCISPLYPLSPCLYNSHKVNITVIAIVNRSSPQHFPEIPQFQTNQLSWFYDVTLLFRICSLPGKTYPTLEITGFEYMSTGKITDGSSSYKYLPLIWKLIQVHFLYQLPILTWQTKAF